MRTWPLLRKIATRIFAGVCLLYLITLAVVQVGQHVLRHRAELLIADLQQLHKGPHTWADLQFLMTRWGKYGHYEESCTPQACEYQIQLEDAIGKTLFQVHPEWIAEKIAPLLLRAHWNGAGLSIQIRMANSSITEWWEMFLSEVPKGAGPDCDDHTPGYTTYCSGAYALMAHVTESSHPASFYWEWPGSSPHPNYSMTQPSGCMNCMGINSHITRSVPPPTMDRIARVNLDCITRWTPCAVPKDILPGGWQELEDERKLRRTSDDRADHCGFSIEEMVLASDLILRVIALNDETHSQGDYINTSHYAGRLLATLHGTSDLKPGAELQFETRHEGTAPFAIYKGTQVIILGAEPPNEGAIYYPHCGAIPATPENLSRVMKAAPNIPPATPN